MFGTLQDRLPKELTLAGICDAEAANRFIRDVYLPLHNARFARPPQIAESAFVAAHPALLAEILCIEQQRIVARDNTLTYAGRRLQLPATPLPLRQGQGQGARISGRDAGRIPRPAAHRSLQRAGHRAAPCPDRGQLDAVLAAVKARPGEGRARGEHAATAGLDRSCARRRGAGAGRDEETAPGSNKETDSA
jgi:hypothetical protein